VTDIEVLDPTQTEEALAHHRLGKTESLLAKIADHLSKVVDTDASVFVAGMNDSTINSLRTRMYRRNTVITVRKISRDGAKGHVIMARTVQPEEQG
jgi:16S rRNA G1207 methylase RsmC